MSPTLRRFLDAVLRGDLDIAELRHDLFVWGNSFYLEMGSREIPSLVRLDASKVVLEMSEELAFEPLLDTDLWASPPCRHFTLQIAETGVELTNLRNSFRLSPGTNARLLLLNMDLSMTPTPSTRDDITGPVLEDGGLLFLVTTAGQRVDLHTSQVCTTEDLERYLDAAYRIGREHGRAHLFQETEHEKQIQRRAENGRMVSFMVRYLGGPDQRVEFCVPWGCSAASWAREHLYTLIAFPEKVEGYEIIPRKR